MTVQCTIEILDPFGQVHGHGLLGPRTIFAFQTRGEDVAVDETDIFSFGAEAGTVPVEYS